MEGGGNKVFNPSNSNKKKFLNLVVEKTDDKSSVQDPYLNPIMSVTEGPLR